MISKKALVAAFVGLIFVVGGTATVLESFGTISGTADVERPLEIEEVYYESNVSEQAYGEYILLKANTEVDMSAWNLSSASEDVNTNNVTDTVSPGYIALVDNKSSIEAPEGVAVYNVGTVTEDGLSDSGEKLNLSYIPERVSVHIVDYPGSCNDAQAYNASAEKCEDAYLEVSAQ